MLPLPNSLELALRQQPLLEPTLRTVNTAFDDAFWTKFAQYLENNYDKKTVYDRLSYSKRYAHVLTNADAKDLLVLTLDKQKHAMKALAVLSKFLGCYDQWKRIRENYQLKWSSGNSLHFFEDFFNGDKNYSEMSNWLKETSSNIPKEYSNVLLYCTLTGLRADEACKSVQLVRTDMDKYLRKDKMILEHYKYPQTFIRRTKMVYISVASEPILELAKECGHLSYGAMSCYIRKHGFDMKMKYCRKIFSTYLRRAGIEPEIIDLLQGRVPKSVFARHYYKEDFNPDRIRNVLDSLHDTICESRQNRYA